MPTATRSKGPAKKKPATKPEAKPTETKKSSPIIQWTDAEANAKPKILSCGKSKAGKTFFAGSFPKPLFLNTDKGTTTLRKLKIPFVTFVRCDQNIEEPLVSGRYGTIMRMIDQIGRKEAPFDFDFETVVLDSISAMSDLLEVEAVEFPASTKGRDKTDEALQLQDYNIIQRKLFAILDRLRELPYNVVVVTELDYVEEEASGRMIWNPAATGKKIGPRIPHFFDEVYYHRYDDKGKRWTLTPVQDRSFPHGGSRFGVPMEEVENPNYAGLKKYYK
jgi:hypothetical protein